MANYFAHPTAEVHTQHVGVRARLGAYTRLASGATVGQQSWLGDRCTLEDGVCIGRAVRIGDGVSLPPGVWVGDEAILGPRVAFEDGRSRPEGPVAPTRIGEGARIGAGAVIRCGVTIGQHAVVEPGAVVRADVPDHGHIGSVPGSLDGWVCLCGKPLALPQEGKARAECACGEAYALEGGRVRRYVQA